MTDTSDRLKLPLLATGQAQKEATHNEALTLADMLMQPVVQSIAPASVPAAPQLGQCWIVGTAATGAWAGHDGALACWSAGGWRFADPFEGMSVWNLASNSVAKRGASSWSSGIINAAQYRINDVQVVTSRQNAIDGPTGGTVIDAESRIAVAAILTTLRTHGLIAP
jgi:Protein of unknown function (DUF2793)